MATRLISFWKIAGCYVLKQTSKSRYGRFVPIYNQLHYDLSASEILGEAGKPNCFWMSKTCQCRASHH